MVVDTQRSGVQYARMHTIWIKPFTVDAPTGEDVPSETRQEMRVRLLNEGHRLARGRYTCLPWCEKCRRPQPPERV